MYWVARFLDNRPNVSERRNAADKSRARMYILPHFRESKVRGLNQERLERWIERLEQRDIGGATILAIMNILRQALEEPTARGLLKSNPAKGLKLDRSSQVREITDADTISEPEFRAICAQMERPYQLLCWVAWETGASWSECLGLRTGDLFLDQNALTIGRTQVVEESSGFTYAEGKPRLVGISKDLSGSLGDFLERTGDWRHDDWDWVFLTTNRHAHPLRPNFNALVWRPALSAAGINDRKYTFHNLRHSAAVRMILGGADVETVTRNLGNKTSVSAKRMYRQFFERAAKKR